MSKYKYYRHAPKISIAQDILKGVLLAGTLIVATGSSPYFIPRILKAYPKWKHHQDRQRAFQNAFYRLRRRGHIAVVRKNHQVYISLTKEGKQKAGRFQINHLAVSRPKRWAKTWWLMLFDIEELHKPKRESLRGIIKELGFYLLQKSVWVHAFPCRDEVELLKDFFGLTARQVRLIEVSSLDGEEDELKAFFHVFG